MHNSFHSNQQAASQLPQQQEQEESFQSLFPPPPIQYYKNYGPGGRPLPPPQPITGQPYRSFGMMLTHEDTLRRPRDFQVKELFENEENAIADLKRMNRSLCFNFLELLHILVDNPNSKLKEDASTSIFEQEKFEEEVSAGRGGREKFAWELKIQQIELLLINMVHLLNTYRPMQARQQLITIIEDSLTKRTDAATLLNNTLTQCRDMLQQTKLLLQKETTLDEKSNSNTSRKRKREEDSL
jgi:mediator of RNA polymerase II transcription subunit 7